MTHEAEERFNSFKDEWSPDNTKPIDQVTWKSTVPGLWVCSVDSRHTFTKSPKIRSRTDRAAMCPYCSGRSLMSGVNDLKTLYPDIARQFCTSNNITADMVRPNDQNNSYTWVCKENSSHKFSTTPKKMISGRKSCRKCDGLEVDPGVTDLKTVFPELAQEWGPNNDKSPSEVAAKGSYQAEWVCKDSPNHTWTATVANRSSGGTGCPYCAGMRPEYGVNDLETQFPVIASMWSPNNPGEPRDYLHNSTKVVDWVCRNNPQHQWSHRIKYMTRYKTGCLVCSGELPDPGVTDLKSINPRGLMDEWHEDNLIDPSKILPNSTSKALWRCSTNRSHVWETRISDRTRGAGCPHCSKQTSMAEYEIVEFIHHILPETEIIHGARKVVPGMSIDIYLPEHNLAIEYNGIYWHSEKFVGKNMTGVTKQKSLEEQGISLFVVWESDWLSRKEVILSMLRHRLGVASRSVYARNCTLVHVDSDDSATFLDMYHIQGPITAAKSFGLWDEESDCLVAVMSISLSSGKPVLARYATSVSVPGGHSRLLKYATSEMGINEIFTFADLGVSSGDLYRKTGWEEVGRIPPDYKYKVGSTLQHKFLYRKDRFASDPNLIYTEGMTERELAKANNLLRVYDYGKIKFRKKVGK